MYQETTSEPSTNSQSYSQLEKSNKQLLWDKITDKFKKNAPQVDNQRIERLMQGGFIFGFTASDLLILLSAFLTLVFLQLQPYIIPYLEGTLGAIPPNLSYYEEQYDKTATPSTMLNTSSPSAKTTVEEKDSTQSAETNENLK
jgi:hypothetical protein